MKRDSKQQKLTKAIIVVAEGEKTEYNYLKQFFKLLDNRDITLYCVRHKHSNPKELVRAIDKKIREEVPDPNNRDYTAWIIFDYDLWTQQERSYPYNWAESDPRRRAIISKPCFEFWVWLHFNPGRNFDSPKECLDELCKIKPDYNKAHLFKWLKLEDVRKVVKNSVAWKEELKRRGSFDDNVPMYLLNNNSPSVTYMEHLINSVQENK